MWYSKIKMITNSNTEQKKSSTFSNLAKKEKRREEALIKFDLL